MLNLCIGLFTVAYALIAAYARYDLRSSYYVVGALYAVGIGMLVGLQPARRTRSWRLHAWIAGICGFFLFAWSAAGAPASLSGEDLSSSTAWEFARRVGPRMVLLYVGIYLGFGASRELLRHVSTGSSRLLHLFLKTPQGEFTAVNHKVLSVLILVLLLIGIVSALTGDLPSSLLILRSVGHFLGVSK